MSDKPAGYNAAFATQKKYKWKVSAGGAYTSGVPVTKPVSRLPATAQDPLAPVFVLSLLHPTPCSRVPLLLLRPRWGSRPVGG